MVIAIYFPKFLESETAVVNRGAHLGINHTETDVGVKEAQHMAIAFVKSADVLGPKLIFVTGLVIFVTAVARLVCPDLLG